MVPKSNILIHTNFVDGRDTAEEMVLAALRLGFHTLGFSEHGHADYDDCSLSPAQEPAYRAEILRLKAKYAGRIHLLLGYEHDWLSPPSFEGYEYVIESIHYAPAGGELFSIDRSREDLQQAVERLFGGDPYAMCRTYFSLVCDSCLRSRADVLGRPAGRVICLNRCPAVPVIPVQIGGRIGFRGNDLKNIRVSQRSDLFRHAFCCSCRGKINDQHIPFFHRRLFHLLCRNNRKSTQYRHQTNHQKQFIQIDFHFHFLIPDHTFEPRLSVPVLRQPQKNAFRFQL